MTYRERYVFGAPPADEPPTVAAVLNRIANRALEHERQQLLEEHARLQAAAAE